jgi:hypothetical protein
LLVGGIIGLLTGLGAAYMILQRSDEETPPKMGAADGVRLGLLLLGLLRQVGELTGGKDE